MTNQETTKNPILEIIEELEGHKEEIENQAQEVICVCNVQGELEFQAEEIEKQLEALKSIVNAVNPGEAK
jgi:regulator of RNase E activity RraB